MPLVIGRPGSPEARTALKGKRGKAFAAVMDKAATRNAKDMVDRLTLYMNEFLTAVEVAERLAYVLGTSRYATDLLEREAEYRQIVDSTSDGLLITDLDLVDSLVTALLPGTLLGAFGGGFAGMLMGAQLRRAGIEPYGWVVNASLAASTTTFARTCRSSPVARSMYDTPVARPSLPTVTSRAIAPVSSVSRFVAMAGAMSTSGLEKFAFTEQPRLHCPQ